MEPQVATLLEGVLARIDRGERVTEHWLRRTYPQSADELIESLDLVGLLERDATLPRMVGPFRVLQELGRGSMGIVYLVEATSGFEGVVKGSRVALKVIRSEHEGIQAHRQFLMEGLAGTRVDHPNVVRTIAACRLPVDGFMKPCLLMEVVTGITLPSLHRRGALTPEPLCRLVAKEVAQGLIAIHDLGIVHRDVKPSNIVYCDDGRVRLTDLGIAKLVEGHERRDAAGSPLYCAPEQLDPDRRIDGRADLYALGRTLFELATGERPPLSGPLELPVAYSPSFCRLVRRCTRPDPDERISSARAFLASLGEDVGEANPGTWGLQAAFLHGRSKELAACVELLEASHAGRGGAVWITGPAGMGKSRLLSAVVGQARGLVLHVTFGRESLRPTPPLLRLLMQCEFAALALETLPRRHRDTIRRWGSSTTGRFPHSSDLADAVGAWVCALSDRSPLVLCVEDAHVAEHGELALLRVIARRIRTSRVSLFVALRKPQERAAPVVSKAEGLSLDLPPLEGVHLRALVSDAFFPRRLAMGLCDLLASQSGGVPLHALTALRVIAADRALVRRPDGTWGCPLGARSLIDRLAIDGLLRKRLEALPLNDQRFLQRVACLGPRFSISALDFVAESAEATSVLRDHAEKMVRRGEWLCATGDGYAFTHQSEYEVVYHSAREVTKRGTHASLARRLQEELADARLLEPCCRNALRGGLSVLARETVMSAMSGLCVQRRWLAAAALAQEALAQPGLLVGEKRLSVLAALAGILHRFDAEPDDVARVRELRDLADALQHAEQSVRSRTVLAWAHTRLQEYDRAASFLRAAELRAAELGSTPLNEHVLHVWSTLEHLRGNRERHAELVRRYASSWSRSADPAIRFTGCMDLGTEAYLRRDLVDADRHFRAAHEAARASDTDWHLVLATGHIALVALARNDLRAARRGLDRTAALAAGFQDRRIHGIIKGRQGLLATAQGDLTRAISRFDASLSDAQDAGDLREVATQLVGLGDVYMWLGAMPKARACIEEASRVFGSRAPADAAGAQCQLSLIEFWSGAQDLAASNFRASIAVADPRGAVHHRIRWGEALAVCGMRDEAIAQLTSAREDLPEMGHPNWMNAWIQAWLALLRAGDPQSAVQILSATPQRVPALVRVRMHYAVWARTGRRQHLEEARGGLDTIASLAPRRYRTSLMECVPFHRLAAQGERPANL